MTLPNFLIVGAARAGTTSTYYYLKQHPEVFMSSVKEPRFFIRERLAAPSVYSAIINREFVRDLNSYLALFREVGNEKAIGEATPAYLFYYDTAIQEIKQYLGKDVKIVIILRNPIHRAFSHYQHQHYKVKRQHLSFECALAAEEKNRQRNKYVPGLLYKSNGFYYESVKAYLENFPHVKICMYDDLRNDSLYFIKDLYDFLEVDSSFAPNLHTKYNVSGIPKNKLLHFFLTRPNSLRSSLMPIIRVLIPSDKISVLAERIRSKTVKKPQMKPETKQYLLEIYREDILKLQDLIQRDLSHWLE